MSVIAVKINSDNIEIVADSILTKGELKRTTNFPKLRRYVNLIVGGCGNAEELSLFFEFCCKNSRPLRTISEVHKYLREFAEYKSEYLGADVVENEYILISGDTVFEVDEMFVQEISDYTAIGEGQPYALAALALGHTATEAVEVSCKLCCHTAEPLIRYIQNI